MKNEVNMESIREAVKRIEQLKSEDSYDDVMFSLLKLASPQLKKSILTGLMAGVMCEQEAKNK